MSDEPDKADETDEHKEADKPDKTDKPDFYDETNPAHRIVYDGNDVKPDKPDKGNEAIATIIITIFGVLLFYWFLTN